MKDRLTEILKSCFKGANSIEELADKLIAEGVRVPLDVVIENPIITKEEARKIFEEMEKANARKQQAKRRPF